MPERLLPVDCQPGRSFETTALLSGSGQGVNGLPPDQDMGFTAPLRAEDKQTAASNCGP